ADDAAIHQHPALALHGLDRAPQFSGEDPASQLAAHSELAGDSPRLLLVAGPRFTTAVLSQHLADELLIYTAPLLLGGPHLAVGELGIDTLTELNQLNLSSIHQIEADTVSTLRNDH